MLKLLHKTIGVAFFTQHAGLFLVICYLLFGAVEGSQLIPYHYALLMAICSSPLIWMIVFLLWVVYSVKCYLFVKQKLDLRNFTFSTELTKIKKNHQIRIWLKVYAFMLMPIIGYAVLMLVIAVRNQYIFSFFATLVGLTTLLISLSFLTFKSTNYNFNPKKNFVVQGLFELRKPFWSWPLFYLVHEQPLMLFACKFVSLLAFKAILWVFADLGNDIKVLLTAMLAVVLSHAVLLVNWVKFDVTYLSFVQSLPISIGRRLRYWLMVIFTVLVPELGLCAWTTHLNMPQIGGIMLFGTSTLFALFILVYLVKADMDRYVKYLLFFFFIAMLAILAGYYLLFSAALLLISMFVFLKRLDFVSKPTS
ncbi:MAG: hypothetical protein EOO07_11270 [Chitinophagaceae bacterium]|nr:MAG: hypothetical protein EOO07_11270 [Chitinophagaceae bacterium]